MSRPPHVLILVQNLPVPLDRRVWTECRALRAVGSDVSVICPTGPGHGGHEVLEGVRIRRYRPAPPVRGPIGSLFACVHVRVRTAWLSLRVWRRAGFGNLLIRATDLYVHRLGRDDCESARRGLGDCSGEAASYVGPDRVDELGWRHQAGRYVAVDPALLGAA